MSINLYQGDILASDVLSKLKLDLELPNDVEPEKKLALAISHSCDIASSEPDIEFILGVVVTKIDGNCAYAKSPRKLHLELNFNGNFIILELRADQKFKIKKETLKNFGRDSRYLLNIKQKEILQSWLAARYKRQALPDALKNRLNPIWEFLEKHGKKNAKGILAYYIKYDPDEELPCEYVYDFSLYVIYSIDDFEFENQAKKLVSEIIEKFPKLIQKTKILGAINLLECKAYSEMEFTIKDQRENVLYRFDYLSYRTDPHGLTI